MSSISEPLYTHREYSNDVGSKADLCQRAGLAILPLLSMHQGLSFPISVGMGGLRAWTTLNELSASGTAAEISYQTLQSAIAVAALAGTLFKHPVGMLISTGHDLLIEIFHLLDHLNKGEHKKVLESCGSLINNALYLALFFHGTLELSIASLALQIMSDIYQLVVDGSQENYFEAAGHLAMLAVHGTQLKDLAKTLKMQYARQELERVGILNCGGTTLNVEADIHFSDASGQLKQEYIQSISEAKSSVEIMTFTFSDPEMINLLAKKANEGVKITIVIDAGHRGSLISHADKFTLLTRTAGEGRVHHKITVIDQETVWIGSANLSPNALTLQNNTMICLKSREMAQALHEETEVFLGTRKRSPTPLPPISINGQQVELLMFPHVPFEAANPPEKALNDFGKKRILQMIEKARLNLRFAICVWTDPDLMKAVINAKNRGVNIEVIVWKREESTLQALEQAGITITQKRHLPLMHNKWMIADDEDFLNCSANWSKSWFSRNDESAVIINKLTDKQKQSLLTYWKQLLTA